MVFTLKIDKIIDAIFKKIDVILNNRLIDTLIYFDL